MRAKEIINNSKLKLLTKIDGIKVYLVDSSLLSKAYPVWKKYLGSHHYGIDSSHIPEDEIFVSDKVTIDELKQVIMHEYVERTIMKALVLKHKMTPKEAWKIAHYFVKDYIA